MSVRLIIAAAGFCLSLAAIAQVSVRTIPADTRRGTLVAIEVGAVKIDNKLFRLSPGARILSTTNLTVTPNQVTTNALVRYQLDGQGQIRTIWLLTPEEAKRR
jgi:hypothetical protein